MRAKIITITMICIFVIFGQKFMVKTYETSWTPCIISIFSYVFIIFWGYRPLTQVKKVSNECLDQNESNYMHICNILGNIHGQNFWDIMYNIFSYIIFPFIGGGGMIRKWMCPKYPQFNPDNAGGSNQLSLAGGGGKYDRMTFFMFLFTKTKENPVLWCSDSVILVKYKWILWFYKHFSKKQSN